MNNKTLISYFATHANKSELDKIKRINFSELDISDEDIYLAMEKFKNLDEIHFRFGPFGKHFKTIPKNMPNVILQDYTHGEEHVKFILEFAQNCKTVCIVEQEYCLINEYIRSNPELANKFLFSDNVLINLKEINNVDLKGKNLELNYGNIKLIPKEKLDEAQKVTFSGTVSDVEKLTIDELKKIDSITIVIKDASQLSNKKLNELTIKRKLRIDRIQIYAQDNSRNQNKPYSIKNYRKIRQNLDNIVRDIPDYWSEERKFAEIYKRVALEIEYDKKIYDSKDLNFVNNRNLINPLLNKKGVCSGYSDVLKNALSLKGIEAIKVSGDIRGKDSSHEWNKVKINGVWYNVDVTWDREDFLLGKVPQFALKSDEYFSETREEFPEYYMPRANKSYPETYLNKLFGGVKKKEYEDESSKIKPIWDLSNWQEENNNRVGYPKIIRKKAEIKTPYL